MLAQQKQIAEKENKYQKELLSASIEITERERAKIAANVHDEIGIMLHVFKQNISRAKRNPGDTELVKTMLDDTDKAIKTTINLTRSIANELMPSTLGNIGFIESIVYLCNHFNSLNSLKLSFNTELEHIDLDKSASIHLYRLTKEILTNVIKHTRAKKAEVSISLSFKMLNVIVSHDGAGISNDAVNKLIESSNGVGLKSIMGRAQLINASVQYVLVDNDLSKIIIEIPLP